MIRKYEITEKGISNFQTETGEYDINPIYIFIHEESNFCYMLVEDKKLGCNKLMAATEPDEDNADKFGIADLLKNKYIKEIDRFSDPLKMFDEIE